MKGMGWAFTYWRPQRDMAGYGKNTVEQGTSWGGTSEGTEIECNRGSLDTSEHRKK